MSDKIEKLKKFDQSVASQNQRFLNLVIDMIILYIIIIFISDFASENILLAIPFLYYLIFEIITKRTPGKFFTKTKVVKSNGDELDSLSVLKRTLSRYIPFEAFTFLGDKFPIGWHDKISKTVVVSLKTNDRLGSN